MNSRPEPNLRRRTPSLTGLLALSAIAAISLSAVIAGSSQASAATPKPSVTQHAKSDPAKTKKTSPKPPAGPEITWSVGPATANSFDTKRTFFDYSAKPGNAVTDHIAVTNYSAQPVEFHVYAADGTTDYKTAQFTLVSGAKPSKDLGSWVSIEGGASSCPASDSADKLRDCLANLGVRLTVQPNTAVIVPFTITVPKNASPGDHAAGIVAAYTQKGAGKTAVGVEERIGARVYVRVAGKLTPQLSATGQVMSFHGDGNPFKGGTATIGFDLKDTGNTRLSGQPTFKVTGPFGIPIATAKAAEVRELIPDGVAHVQTTVQGVPRLLLLFGGITVTPEHADGNVASDKLPADVHTTAVTWAVPWIWLLIIFVVAAGVVGGWWWRRRSREQLAAALHDYVAQARSDARDSELISAGGDSESKR